MCIHMFVPVLEFVRVCVCTDYSDEMATGVYEQIQTLLLIEEVVRGSGCRNMLNLQL